jgi:parvulin-like peptidyl-prolyl isomerase
MIDKLFQKNISVDIKDEEIKEFYLRDTQKAKIAYIFIPYEKFKFTRDIPTKDIEKYYQENKDLFKREPKVNIAYVILNESDVSNENFLKALSRLETIEEIKSKFSLPIKETGLIGLNDPIPEIGWQPQINKIAFSLAKNSLSQVIQTDKGFIILIKKDEQESFVPPLNDIKTEVKERLIANEAREETKHFAEDLANKIIADKINDLKRIAAAEKLDFKETDYFKYNDYIEGLGLNPKVNEIIFLLKKGEIEKLPLLLENGAYIIQLKDLTPFDEKDFTEKKELYAYRLKQNKELIERLQFLARLKNEAGLKVSLPR